MKYESLSLEKYFMKTIYKVFIRRYIHRLKLNGNKNKMGTIVITDTFQR